MRRRCLLAVLLCCSAEAPVRHQPVSPAALPPGTVIAGVATPAALPVEHVDLEVSDLPSAELVGLLYREILRVPFMAGPSVEADRRPVSFKMHGTLQEAQSEASAYLAGLGYMVRREKGVDQVVLIPPPVPPKPVVPATKVFVYRPVWRDAAELARTLSGLFAQGRFGASGPLSSSGALGDVSTSEHPSPGAGGLQASQTVVSGSQGFLGSQSAPSDVLVFNGTVAEIAKLKAVLPDIDRPQGEVMVRASVFEVQAAQSDGSGLQLAFGLLKSKLSVGIEQPAISATAASAASGGVASALSGNFLSIKTDAIDAVVQALSSDSRFHLLTSPSVRARSGSVTTFTVGAQVPVLSSLAYAGGYNGSTPVQSIEYKDSGVIFGVRPVARAGVIDIDLHQQISDFVTTTTGVNNTPTLTKRDLVTSLSLQDGAVVALGGLTQLKQGGDKEGFSFLPDFLSSKTRSMTRTDIIVILQVSKLSLDDGSPSPSELRARTALPPLPAPPDVR